ncbi:nuclear transcription factor Y subunit B-6 [Phoenix dactylifera]|uniref:Nuclear transcription factor Y subunit B-6 n=1 Tax=Phoenix dactylifera TaxID=42345 RepID=A0A8B8ZRL7_PHODC|nr:nuclear transcription factor Y subunit B-6 [Phoenix dactylifera]
MAGAGDGIPPFPRLQRASSGMARPLAGGVNSSQAGPAGVDADQSGPAAGNPALPGSADPAAATSATQPQVSNLREQDRFMPIANVIRIMRKVLPLQAKISDDAKETIQECVSEYISFITGEANERCQREHRKTITAEDVIWAMGKLGFEDYVAPLNRYLHRYRELEGDQRVGLRGEHFPIIKHRRHPQIRDIDRSPPVRAQTPLIRSPRPPPSSLVMPPTAPLPRLNHLFGEDPGAGYFLGMYRGGDGSGTGNSEAPPMPDFFP